jgi:hypothetical protein
MGMPREVTARFAGQEEHHVTLPKTSAHVHVLTGEQNRDIGDACETGILFVRVRVRIVTTRLAYIHSTPARGVPRMVEARF